MFFRTATARGKAEQADYAAVCANEDSTEVDNDDGDGDDNDDGDGDDNDDDDCKEEKVDNNFRRSSKWIQIMTTKMKLRDSA